EGDLAGVEIAQRVFNQSLNGCAIFLTLPPDNRRPVIRDCDLEARHCLMAGFQILPSCHSATLQFTPRPVSSPVWPRATLEHRAGIYPARTSAASSREAIPTGRPT